MFDPHGIRRYKRRTTRKGQIIQARAVQDPFVINPLHVDAYKEFIIKNNLIETPTPPEPTPEKPPGFNLQWHQITGPKTYQLQPSEMKTFAHISENLAEIYTIGNTSKSPITVTDVEYYAANDYIMINSDNDPSYEIQTTIITYTSTDISINDISNPFMYVPSEWVFNSLAE